MRHSSTESRAFAPYSLRCCQLSLLMNPEVDCQLPGSATLLSFLLPQASLLL
jgi:hypothetical protein